MPVGFTTGHTAFQLGIFLDTLMIRKAIRPMATICTGAHSSCHAVAGSLLQIDDAPIVVRANTFATLYKANGAGKANGMPSQLRMR